MKLVLFDLDGTLTDSAEGIKKSIIYALEKGNFSIPDNATLDLFIGPPIIESYVEHCGMDSETAKKYYKVFQSRYNTIGKFENKVYDGIPKVLKTLQENDFTLAVATAKPENTAREILDYFNLSQYFDIIKGAHNERGLVHKDDILEEALNECHNLLPKGREFEIKYMVGDRLYDMNAAHLHQCISIGVLYGFGSRHELEEANADYIVEDTIGISRVILD